MSWYLRGVECIMVNDGLLLIVLIHHTLDLEGGPQVKVLEKRGRRNSHHLMNTISRWTL